MKNPRVLWPILRRRGIQGVIILLVLGVLLLLSLPLWLPLLLRPILKSQGIQLGDYQRVGYAGFRIKNARGTWPGATATANQIDGFLPYYSWALSGSGTNQQPAWTVSGWNLRISPSSTGTNNDSLLETLDQASRAIGLVHKWAPPVLLHDGGLEWGSNRITLPEAHWQRGDLSAALQTPWQPKELSLHARLPGTPPYQLSVRSEAWKAQTDLRILRLTNHWDVVGSVAWQSNRAELQARFGPNGLLPDEARLDSSAFTVPGELVGLTNYHNLVGSLALGWRTNSFTLDLKASAEPTEARSLWPAAQAQLQAHGTLTEVTVARFEVAAPWLVARLSGPFSLTYAGKLTGADTSLIVSADLSKCPWPGLAGTLRGDLGVKDVGSIYPQVRFTAVGDQLAFKDTKSKSIDVQGDFLWPAFVVSNLVLTMPDGSRFSSSARFDCRQQTLSGGKWEFSGDFLRSFLPDSVRYDRLTAGGELSGSLSNLTQSGRLAATGVLLPGLRASELAAEWNGQGLRLDKLDLRLNAGVSQLELGGQADLGHGDGRSLDLTIKSLALSQRGVLAYTLKSPSAVHWRQDEASQGPSHSSLKLDPIHLQGPSNEVISVAGSTAWPEEADLDLRIEHLHDEVFRDLVAFSVPRLAITNLLAKVHWDHGPAIFDVSFAGGFDLGGQTVAVRGSVAGDTNHISVQGMEVTTQFAPLVKAQGTLPVSIQPSKLSRWLRLDTQARFDLQVTTQESGDLSYPLGEGLTLGLRDPKLTVDLHGTPDKPEARAQFTAATADWRFATNAAGSLKVEQLNVEIVGAETRLSLVKTTGVADGQPFSLTADWALPEGFWESFARSGTLPDARDLTARFQVEDAALGPFTRFVPDVLQPQGRFSLDLSLQPGVRFNGSFALTNAMTRPLGNFTPIHDLQARLAFHDRTVTVERFDGTLGGELVSIKGHASFDDHFNPSFAAEVTGTNLTLVRTEGLILRGDVNLKAAGETGANPVVSGEIKMRDGLFLTALGSLVPGQVALRRPPGPLIGITNEPFADWNVALHISGDRFLRVRTPLFNGALSADTQLKGRLREPEFSGQVRVNSGQVRFPFGTLDVDQGFLDLGGDLAGSRVYILASGRNYSYDLKMEISGPAEAPVVTFSSTPGLSSDQILLMLSGGETPHSDYALSTTAKAGHFASFLGRDALSLFGGSDSSRERLVVRTDEDLSEDGKTTYDVEYRLTPRWSLVGEYDRFNAFNAGVKWRIISR